MIPVAAAGNMASFKKLWLHILLQASCKTAMETVPFCFRNQSKSLAQSITSSHTGNSFTLYSLYSLLQITAAARAFKNLLQNCQRKGNLSISKEGKNCLFPDFYIIDTRSYKSFNVPIRKRIKLQLALQVF
jgi:hypothetical protein